MAKRIVLFFEGSWSNVSLDHRQGNVARLMSMVAPCDETDASEQKLQLTYCDASAAHPLNWKHLTGLNVFQSLERCYHYLATHYREGDEIFCFGASRGAFVARHLCGMLDRVGLLRIENLTDFRAAYSLYRMAQERSLKPAETEGLARIVANTELPIMRFLGVWDTVGGDGIPLPGALTVSRYFGAGLGKQRALPGVQIARQVLALDEWRGALKPALWESDRAPSNYFQDVSQLWFAGSHADVCGHGDSYLGDCSLLWMTEQAEQAGVSLRAGSLRALRRRISELEQQSEAMELIQGHSPQVADGYNEGYSFLEKLGFNSLSRVPGQTERDGSVAVDEAVHPSVDKLISLKHGFYRPRNLLNALAREQVNYTEDYVEQYSSRWFPDAERRSNGRKPCLEMVALDIAEAHYDCQVFNRSETGLGIRCGGELKRGEVVDLKEYAESRRARVMWVHDDRAGLAFAA